MESDDFFKNHIQKKYDVIFIDGLHTAYQVTKDIYNSINNLNDGGIIIIDDIYPHSENEQYSLELLRDGPNTGDVWKAVYNVLDTLIEISEAVYFFPNVMRGNLVLKIKSNNDKNISIDNTIPTMNTDGNYKGDDKEWNKYNYRKDFVTYFNRLSSFIHEF
jgi:hypothetical protein